MTADQAVAAANKQLTPQEQKDADAWLAWDWNKGEAPERLNNAYDKRAALVRKYMDAPQEPAAPEEKAPAADLETKHQMLLKTADRVMNWEGRADVQDGRPEIYGFRQGQDPEYPSLSEARIRGDEDTVRRIATQGLLNRAYQAGAGKLANPALKAQLLSLADLRGPGGAAAIMNAVGDMPLQEAAKTIDPEAAAKINKMPLDKVLRRVRIAREIYDKAVYGDRHSTHGNQSGRWWDLYGAGLQNRYDQEQKFFSSLAK